MGSKRGKNRSSGAVSDKRSNDKKGSPESSKSESEKPELPLEYEWETEDGLKVSLSPGEAEISREYQLSENDFVEFSAGIDISPLDWRVEKTGDDASVSGEISLPGDILGLSGGISVDLSTGEITGGELGVEVGGVGVEVSVSGEDGCQKSLEVSLFGVGVSYTRDDCEPEENKKEPGTHREPLKGEFTPSDIDGLRTWLSRYKGCIIDLWFGTAFKENPSDRYNPIAYPYWDDTMFVAWSKHPTSNFYRSYFHQDFEKPRFNGMFYSGSRVIEINIVHLLSGNERLLEVFFEYPRKFGYASIRCFNQDEFGRKIELRRRIPPAPPPERIMNDCCRTSTKLMREIHQVLGCRELIDKGLKVPNRWIVAGGKKTTKLADYLEIAAWQMRMADHLGIHPFVAKVTDANAAQAGNQSVEMEFANATAAAKQIAELLLENKGDSATRLNLMMRTAIAVGQVLNVVSIVAKNVENLINFVGMPIQEKVKLVKMPFDFTFGKRKEQNGKGFGKQSNASQSGIDALDINTEEATEALLPKFMQDEQQPIVYKQFKPKQPGLIDIIRGKK